MAIYRDSRYENFISLEVEIWCRADQCKNVESTDRIDAVRRDVQDCETAKMGNP